MSKGVVLQNLGDCRYRVQQLYGVDSVKRELAELSERLITIETELPQRQLELVTAVEAVESKVHQIDLLIPDYVADPDSHREQLTELRVELVRLQGAAAEKRYALNRLKSQKLSITKRQQVLRQIPEAREVDAWCADYSEGLTGEVGLVDVNDEGGQGVIVQPGYEGGAVYRPERDGQLTPRAAQSGVQVYFNAALLPGVQKWRPRYRLGVISELENDSCTVVLDSAQSSAQSLDINSELRLIDVPIVYMDCNGAAFSDGDRVLVRFTESGPLVVGFEREPVPCSAEGFICVPSQIETDWVSVEWGEPFVDGAGSPINPPLGSVGGDNPAWIVSRGWRYKRGQAEIYGIRDWVGPNDSQDVLSWSGPNSRLCALYRAPDDDAVRFSRGTLIFWKGQRIAELPFPGVSNTSITLEGAAIQYRNNGRYLFACASNALAMHFDRPNVDLTLAIHEWYWPENGDPLYLGVVADFSADHAYPPCSVASFSEDGASMVITCAQQGIGDLYVYRWHEGGAIEEERVFPPELDGELETTRVETTDSTEGVLSANGSSPAAEVVLYYEYQGNDEVPVTLSYSGRAINESATATKSQSDSARSESQGGFVVRCAGSVIYESGPVVDASSMETMTVQTFTETVDGDEVTWTGVAGSASSSRQETDVKADDMLIDGRYGVVLMLERYRSISESKTYTPQFANEPGNLRDTLVDSSVSELIEYRASLWHDGQAVSSSSVTTLDVTNQDTAYEYLSDSLGVYGQEGTFYSDIGPIGTRRAPSNPAEPGAGNDTLASSMAVTGSKALASAVFRVAPQTDLPLHWATGLGNPVVHLMERSPDDGYLLYRIGRF